MKSKAIFADSVSTSLSTTLFGQLANFSVVMALLLVRIAYLLGYVRTVT